jgi:membrane-associated protein
MDMLLNFLELILHIDRHLAEFASQYGAWIYALLFAIIFSETGFVVTPFLPGDSLLFAAGALAAVGEMNVHGLFALLTAAAIAGNSVNYAVGYFFGEKAFAENARFLKKEYLDRTHLFFEKHGGKTIILTRFVPILRTFAPFVAGAGRMSLTRFQCYNFIGAVAWTASFIYGGYFFGNLPFVKQNFVLVILGIIILSIMPGIIEYWRQKANTA